MTRLPIRFVALGFVALGAAVCTEERKPIEGGAVAGLAVTAATAGCASDSLRPATAAPAEGLWVSDSGAEGGRVAAMIGPAQVREAEPRVTRQVETVETAPSGAEIRHRADAAAVRLELLPHPGRETLGTAASTDSVEGARPAAVYPVAVRILIASYEPCAPAAGAPRLRYLRRGADGRPVTDVMLRRTSGGN